MDKQPIFAGLVGLNNLTTLVAALNYITWSPSSDKVFSVVV